MKTIWNHIGNLVKQKENFIIATIIAESGSTPRRAGAKMLVKEDGTTIGTIGGGAVEYQAGLLAKQLLHDKKSCKKEYLLTVNETDDIGMVCGGDVEVYFQYISGMDESFRVVCETVQEALGHNDRSWLVTDLTEEMKWSTQLYKVGQADQALEVQKAGKILVGDRLYYSEPMVRSGAVYVFGGGHVAQELVPILSHVGFRCVLFDDRKEFANQQLFPMAEETIVGDFDHVFEHVTITANDYVVIMSRGHEFDYRLQKQMLETKAPYIGVMGSRHKIKTIRAKLERDGFTEADINRFQTPIGLEIQAETPAEIAISVAGELILTRAVREGRER